MKIYRFWKKIHLRGGTYPELLLNVELVAVFPVDDEFAVVWDVVVDVGVDDEEDIDFKYFNESQCDLYSIGVFGGRFKTRRNVSRIRLVLLISVALLFHTDNKSSYR